MHTYTRKHENMRTSKHIHAYTGTDTCDNADNSCKFTLLLLEMCKMNKRIKKKEYSKHAFIRAMLLLVFIA